MKSILLLTMLCAFCTIAHSQTQVNVPAVFQAELDKQFDSGSGITSIPLDTRQTNDLAVLGKVWGYVKYYHPAVNKGEYNWDYELFRVLPKIMACKNDHERNQILADWINKPGITEEAKETRSDDEVKVRPDIKWIEEVNVLGPQLSARLTGLRYAKRNSPAYYAGVDVGSNPDFKNEKPYADKRYPDAGYRLLALYRYWNIVQYFFPYKHLIEEDWKNVLPEFIPVFINAANELEYKKAVLMLITRIHDSHASVRGLDEVLETFRGLYFAPLLVTFIENKAVVTRYLPEAESRAAGLKKGDVITAVNGLSVDDIIKTRLALTPASNYATKLRNIANDLLRSTDSTITLTYQREGATNTATLNGYLRQKMYSVKPIKDTCFRYVQPDIGYIFIGTLKRDYIANAMPGLLKTKGLIIDLRSYPTDEVTAQLCGYLMPESTPFVKLTFGDPAMPGLFTFSKTNYVGKKKNADHYKGQVIILVNEQSQSASEYAAMAYRTAPRAMVIGSTTAGADGNVSKFYLPGGIYTAISGIGVYTPDKRETQRVGIVPDITVQPTIKGFISGRDEVLEKAIEIINKSNK